jgi:hypothetical protein
MVTKNSRYWGRGGGGGGGGGASVCIYTKLEWYRFPLVTILNQHEMAIIVTSSSTENSTNSLELTELSSINKFR